MCSWKHGPIISASNLKRYFKVRIEGDTFGERINSFFRPSYRIVKALDGVSFTICQGESVGYIGLNGAGKSTTIKLLCGVLVPTSGEIRTLGKEPHKNRTANANRIGLMMGQRTQLLWDLPVKESFVLLGKIYGLKPFDYKANVEMLLDTLDITTLWDTPARMLSLGQRMQCDLALTFLHNPEIVFLDEPTIGLDVFARDNIRGFLNMMRTRGVTIFLASHDLDDLDAVTDRVILLHEGRIVFDGPKESLEARVKERVTKATGTTHSGMTLEEMVKQFYRNGEK
ncbi:MAG: ABC transporter ATP-binding protein [Bacillota bacterium]